MAYHDLVVDGDERIFAETGEVVRISRVQIKGTLEIFHPDTQDGHGGTLLVRTGDILWGRDDGRLYGYRPEEGKSIDHIFKRKLPETPIAKIEEKK